MTTHENGARRERIPATRAAHHATQRNMTTKESHHKLSALELAPIGELPLTRASEMALRPPPACLIEGMLIGGTSSALIGQPGSGKGLIAIDMAQRISRGIDYHGRPTKRGAAIYLAMERAATIGARLQAWSTYHNAGDDSPLYVVPATFPLWRPTELDRVERAIDRAEIDSGLPVRFIVTDTLAKAMLPADENDTKEMGYLTLALQQLAERGAHTMAIHHFNATGQRERGNTSLRGHVDTLSIVRKAAHDRIALSCDKQNDLPFYDPMHFAIVHAAKSATIKADAEIKTAAQLQLEQLPAAQLAALRTLGDGQTSMVAWQLATPDMSRSSFYAAARQLKKDGYVITDDSAEHVFQPSRKADHL